MEECETHHAEVVNRLEELNQPVTSSVWLHVLRHFELKVGLVTPFNKVIQDSSGDGEE